MISAITIIYRHQHVTRVAELQPFHDNSQTVRVYTVFSFFVFKFANEKRITNSFFVFRFQICEPKTKNEFVFKSEVRKTKNEFVFAFRMLRSQCHFGWPVKIGSFGGILRSLAAF